MKLGCVQPSYLSWMPLFDRMAMSDVFVHLDDVQYSKNSFHNRNRIKTPNGDLTLTVPVLYSGNSKAHINEIEIDYAKPWRKKHWKSIEMSYSKAPFIDELGSMIKGALFSEWVHLADLNIALIELLKDYMGIKTPTYRSSEMPVIGESNEKLVNLCNHLGADLFVVKPNTEDYHPKSEFEPNGVGFDYFTPPVREYPQLHGEFIPHLSALDFAMNCGSNCYSKHI
jgi:hypothetical protein